MNSLQGAALFTSMAFTYEHSVRKALEEACLIVEKEAKRAHIGTYDYNWPQLADETQKDRARKGFSDNEPGLRTGEMRDSIEHTVVGAAGILRQHESKAYVGSDNQKLVWFGLVRKTQPPRSVLMQAGMHKRREVAHKLGEEIMVPMLKVR